MEQTLGSQFLGGWYDIFGLAVIAAFFFYWAFAAQNLPSQLRQKLPAFLSNKKMAIFLGLMAMIMSLGKLMEWW